MEPDYLSSEFWQQYLEQPDTVDYPLVFVHGIARREKAWQKTAQVVTDDQYYQMRYEKDGIFHNYDGKEPILSVWSITYYTDRPLIEAVTGELNLYTERLKEMIERIKRITGQGKVVLAAHSMGGLVARKYMVKERANWENVYKVLTVGTPNLGVKIAPGIVGQLRDVKWGSEFISGLNRKWQALSRAQDKKWGVIGAVKLGIVRGVEPKGTDSCGPDYVKLKSAIPYETEAAVDNFGQVVTNTQHFGFRLAVEADHVGLLFHEGTFRGIEWLLKMENGKWRMKNEK